MNLKFTLLGLVAIFCGKLSTAQTIFKQVKDTSNAITTARSASFYTGCTWIDYDNDGRLDFYLIQGGLYHNEGKGKFTKTTNSGLPADRGFGNTWGDYNNDGFVDCLLTAAFTYGSRLFKNNGDGTFTQNTNADLADPSLLRGFGIAFSDINNDGLLDFVVSSPYQFLGIADGNKLLMNNGNENFSRNYSTPITDTFDAYTVPTWSDYDNDGDADLFISSGRVNGVLFQDYAFTNNTIKNGSPNFSRITDAPLGTDVRDGQVWNWIDFDNDGDLDLYITNYTGVDVNAGLANDFYRNDNGLFIKLTAAEVGTIASDEDISLASVWGDYDNDGDLDCVVINDYGQLNRYYESNISAGSSVFTGITAGKPFAQFAGAHSTAAAGDYDNDGDLDLFLNGIDADGGLYQNLRNQAANKNNWAIVTLTGTASNRSAIGAKVRVKAKINGKSVWQMREVSAQNSFNCMNMLPVHFGFGKATIIDSAIIEWPSGQVDYCTNIAVNKRYKFTEGSSCNLTLESVVADDANNLFDIIITPNPFKSQTNISFNLKENKKAFIVIYDAFGKVLFNKNIDGMEGRNSVIFNKPSEKIEGICFCKITVGEEITVKQLVLID